MEIKYLKIINTKENLESRVNLSNVKFLLKRKNENHLVIAFTDGTFEEADLNDIQTNVDDIFNE